MHRRQGLTWTLHPDAFLSKGWSLRSGVSRLLTGISQHFLMWTWKRDPGVTSVISVPTFSFLPRVGQISRSPLGLCGLNQHRLIPLKDVEDQKSCKGALGRAACFLESLEETLFPSFCCFYGCLRSLAYSLHLLPSSVEQQSCPASNAASLLLVLCLFATQTLAVPSTDLDNPD